MRISNQDILKGQPLLRKVPEVTAYFWIIKLLSTAMGEAMSDYLVRQLSPYLAVALGFVAFAAAINFQFKARRYIPWVYWLSVTMVAVFGTMAADVLHVGLGVPYIVSAPFFAVALAIIFSLWYKVEGTLSIHSITSPRRELFYWLTVLATFAMGTALGDLAAYTANLGFLAAGLVFAALFVLPAIAWRWFKLNPIVAFWLAYIMTRPLGASFADWTGKAKSAGGLGWGDLLVSLVLTLFIIGFVGYLSHVRSPRDQSQGAVK